MSPLGRPALSDYANDDVTEPMTKLPRGMIVDLPRCALCSETLDRDDVLRYWCTNGSCELVNMQQGAK